MKESDYLNVSNRIRIQAAQELLRSVLVFDEKIIKEKELKKIQITLSAWVDKLFDAIEVKS